MSSQVQYTQQPAKKRKSHSDSDKSPDQQKKPVELTMKSVKAIINKCNKGSKKDTKQPSKSTSSGNFVLPDHIRAKRDAIAALASKKNSNNTSKTETPKPRNHHESQTPRNHQNHSKPAEKSRISHHQSKNLVNKSFSHEKPSHSNDNRRHSTNSHQKIVEDDLIKKYDNADLDERLKKLYRGYKLQQQRSTSYESGYNSCSSGERRSSFSNYNPLFGNPIKISDKERPPKNSQNFNHENPAEILQRTATVKGILNEVLGFQLPPLIQPIQDQVIPKVVEEKKSLKRKYESDSDDDLDEYTIIATESVQLSPDATDKKNITMRFRKVLQPRRKLLNDEDFKNMFDECLKNVEIECEKM
jgi:hypothetical protein